ncbi:F-box/kelch-repeat protein At3g23880-like [Lotus japonicus]|uniref:F-box/kelch-repeat protein At3g23880-like n=1 Tax=Lotus japonicus TaxID=34305 RepID=UPI00258E3D21|nr:F-box/kelch-repeat protein At3g23880-like [Lotus japonicus]
MAAGSDTKGGGTLTPLPSLSSSSNPPGEWLHAPPLPTLPFELVEDILCRLPVKSLLRFRCVCKSWNSLISDTKFARRHLHEFTRYNLILKSGNHFNSYPLQSDFSAVTPGTTRIEYPLNSDYNCDIVGSCNGILCYLGFSESRSPHLGLWNPSIRTCMELPPLRGTQWWQLKIRRSYGFGYDHLIENYKVVAVFSDMDGLVTEVKVYTLGDDSWRTIQEVFRGYPHDIWGKFVSGTVNWLSYVNVVDEILDHEQYIMSLDLGKESVRELCLPDVPKDGLALGVLRDCLSVVDSLNGSFCVVWVMMEHGNDESWTKMFSVYLGDLPLYISKGDNEVLLPQNLVVCNYDEVLLPSFSNFVICNYEYSIGKVSMILDIQNGKSWILPVTFFCLEPAVYAESLISPWPQY